MKERYMMFGWKKRDARPPVPENPPVLGGLVRERGVGGITWRWKESRGNMAIVEVVENCDSSQPEFKVGMRAEIPHRDLVGV